MPDKVVVHVMWSVASRH